MHKQSRGALVGRAQAGGADARRAFAEASRQTQVFTASQNLREEDEEAGVCVCVDKLSPAQRGDPPKAVPSGGAA